MPNVPSGYQPDTKLPSARRADFELLRRNVALQRSQGDLQAEIDAAEARLLAAEAKIVVLEAKTATTSWVNVTAFLNGWVNYGSGYQVARYRKVGDRVELEGLIRSGTLGLHAFVLPVGFCPPLNLALAAMSGDPQAVSRFDIGNNGWVKPIVGVTGYFSIHNSFSVTP